MKQALTDAIELLTDYLQSDDVEYGSNHTYKIYIIETIAKLKTELIKL